MKELEILKTEVHSIGRFDIVVDKLQTDGEPYPYSYVHIKEGVVVLAIYHSEIVLIKQYRHSLRSWQYEFPAGMISENEEPENTAKRELFEETGYTAANIKSLGWVYPSPGSTTEKVHLFLAICEAHIKACPEDSEQIEVITVSEDCFRKMLMANEFCHGGGMAAYLKYCLGERIVNLPES